MKSRPKAKGLQVQGSRKREKRKLFPILHSKQQTLKLSRKNVCPVITNVIRTAT